ncbi:MAG TPA: hypothetical protein VGK23_08525 [Methanomassiliicoccales archaeon]
MPIDYTDEDLAARWEEFFESSENRVRVAEVADLYPEVRSINIAYAELDQFDPDMAQFMLEEPERVLSIGESVVRKQVQQTRGNYEIHLRFKALAPDSRVDVRKLRSEHLGKLVAIEGLVRKATDVRPKLVEAVFRCFRCPAKIVEIQEGLQFKEPLECYKEQNGCGRSGGSTKFTLLTEESSYVDTQKIEIQENPEGLRGGAQPERLTGYLEDDLAGTVSPGDRIVINGILRSVQKAQGNNKSTLFDINLEVHSVEFQEHEYEEVNITPEEEELIIQEAHSPNVFSKIIKSISPTIYGYDEVKESMALQLFGGSHKQLDDGTRVRGDIHILLVGDPGVAKCVTGDSEVMLGSGNCMRIKDLVEGALTEFGSQEVDDGVYAEIDIQVMTFTERGVIEPGRAVRAWKRTAPKRLFEFVTESGRKITVTPTHPLFVQNGMWLAMRHATKIYVGQEIAVTKGQGECGQEDNGWKRGIQFEKVVSKTEVPAPEPFVYDLEVENTHIFVANGILSHNSQLLRYMSELAPRGIYASGKSSSAAGLCVAGDTKIEVKGKLIEIGEFVESRIKSPTEVEKGVYRQEVGVNGLKTVSADGLPVTRPVSSVFRIATPSFLVELKEESGQSITLTPETQVLSRIGEDPAWIRSSDVTADDEVMTVGPAGDHSQPDWSRVTSTERKVDGIPEHVYDLTVEGAHSFIGNGFVVHNTAAAVKDEFGDGRWTLEAGALVLADKGLACIDGEQIVVLKDNKVSKMKEVRPGDIVINFRKGWNEGRVIRNLDKGIEDCIGLTLLTGDEIICTSDHQILTPKGWVQAGKVEIGDSLVIPTDFSSGSVRSGRGNTLGTSIGSDEVLCEAGVQSAASSILLNPVVSIRHAGPRHVYDLVIEGEHNFLVNGGIVHNCIDELDKMTEQDRSSMHEAMESQRISVAKAGITATLQCRCSMLGAANPKYGRFDDNESLSDQINMPPALLSRFDLIFALTDKPKAETDTRIAEHIIMGHVRGEVRRHEDLSVLDDLGVDYKKIMEDTDKLKPVYDKEFLRKYVAHSKRYVPVMSKEARKIIQDKYLSIRKLGEVQGASVPITARQLEAFIRLSEASARIRLSNVVAKEDADRAVRIVEFYLNKMARDSGSMDVDKVMTGFSKTDRNKIAVVRTLIHSNSEPGKGVSFKTLLEHAPEKNLTEQELREALKKLRNAGDIYEPSHDFYKLSSGD